MAQRFGINCNELSPCGALQLDSVDWSTGRIHFDRFGDFAFSMPPAA